MKSEKVRRNGRLPGGPAVSAAAARASPQAQAPLLADLAPVPASAGLVHFTVERQELTRALLTAKAVREGDDTGLGKIQVACHGTVILRVGTAGSGGSQSFFELRLLTRRCLRAGDVTVQGRALHDALRSFGDGPIEVVKSEGRNVLGLRQRALETNLPTVDYVPIDPGAEDMTPAGVIALDQLRDLLAQVVHVAQAAEASAKHLSLVRFAFEEGRLQLLTTDGHRLVRAVQAVPGGESLAGLQLSAADAERLRRLLGAYWQYLYPKTETAPVRLRLSVRPGHYLSGESDALRFTLPHDPRASRPRQKPVAPPPRTMSAFGMHLHAATTVDGRDRQQLERLCRYLLRPPFAQDAVQALPDGPWRRGVAHADMDADKFLARLCALVPPPGFHMVRYFGVLASHHHLRPRVVPGSDAELPGQQLPLSFADRDAAGPKDPPDSKAPRRIGWASLLARVFAVDVTVCRKCGGRMRILEVVDTPDAVARVLHGARAPPRPPPPGQLLLLR